MASLIAILILAAWVAKGEELVQPSMAFAHRKFDFGGALKGVHVGPDYSFQVAHMPGDSVVTTQDQSPPQGVPFRPPPGMFTPADVEAARSSGNVPSYLSKDSGIDKFGADAGADYGYENQPQQGPQGPYQGPPQQYPPQPYQGAPPPQYQGQPPPQYQRPPPQPYQAPPQQYQRPPPQDYQGPPPQQYQYQQRPPPQPEPYHQPPQQVPPPKYPPQQPYPPPKDEVETQEYHHDRQPYNDVPDHPTPRPYDAPFDRPRSTPIDYGSHGKGDDKPSVTIVIDRHKDDKHFDKKPPIGHPVPDYHDERPHTYENDYHDDRNDYDHNDYHDDHNDYDHSGDDHDYQNDDRDYEMGHDDYDHSRHPNYKKPHHDVPLPPVHDECDLVPIRVDGRDYRISRNFVSYQDAAAICKECARSRLADLTNAVIRSIDSQCELSKGQWWMGSYDGGAFTPYLVLEAPSVTVRPNPNDTTPRRAICNA